MERSIINIQGILANSVKLKGSGNLIRRDGWKRLATGVYKLNVDAPMLTRDAVRMDLLSGTREGTLSQHHVIS
jgi:hypothetical protein